MFAKRKSTRATIATKAITVAKRTRVNFAGVIHGNHRAACVVHKTPFLSNALIASDPCAWKRAPLNAPLTDAT